MNQLPEPSTTEFVAGNPLTESWMVLFSSALIAASMGNPLLALLPVATNAVGNHLSQERLKAHLAEIVTEVNQIADKLQRVSDSQYKVINECIIAWLQSTDRNKIDYLKRAIQGSAEGIDFKPQEAALLSRVIRDITAEEMGFLIKNFSYDCIINGEKPKDDSQETGLKTLWIPLESPDSLIVSGLVSLGLLNLQTGTVWDRPDGMSCYSPIVGKLITLIKGSD